MKRIVLTLMLLTLASGLALGQEEGQVAAAPDRGDQGDGPFEKLIIRGLCPNHWPIGSVEKIPVDFLLDKTTVVPVELLPHRFKVENRVSLVFFCW